MNSIEKNLEKIEQNILAACAASGRCRDDISLIVVSKGRSCEEIRAAYDLGVRRFGENRVQEMAAKMTLLPADIEWHLIGHLQRNKVKYVVGKAALIHSIDTLPLAEAISKEAAKRGVTQDILVEVNIAAEASKHGVSPAGCEELLRAIAALPGLRPRGLMTVAPYVEDGEENRRHFALLSQLLVDMAAKSIDNTYINERAILSMGMSGDYAAAITEGATMIRIGTAVFADTPH